MNTINNEAINVSKVNTTNTRLSNAPSGSTKTSGKDSQITKMSAAQDEVKEAQKKKPGFWKSVGQQSDLLLAIMAKATLFYNILQAILPIKNITPAIKAAIGLFSLAASAFSSASAWGVRLIGQEPADEK